MQHATKTTRQFQKTIGRNIYNMRMRQKLTLKKLGTIARISTTTLDQYEIGKNRMQIHELIKIALALKVSPERLLGG